jgi:cyclopropane-fatty-acyl-phospholipid synthase
MYMPAMAYAFDQGWLSVYQVLAQKSQTDGSTPRPWTRRYQYQPAAPVWLTEGLDWGDL